MNSIKHKTAKKITSVLLSATTMVWLAGASAFMPMVASADAASDALIAQLTATIASLTAQLAALSSSSSTSSSSSSSAGCSFSRNLTIGVRGDDVTCLQNYLTVKGFFNYSGGSTGYFGEITRAAVSAWQAANGVSPTAGYFGAISRAKYASMVSSTTTTTTTTTTNTTNVPVTGGGLRVQLATDSPNGVALVAGQAIGELARFVFSNPSSASVRVTTLNFKRIGSSGDSTLANVYLYNGAARLTDAAGVSSTLFSYNNTAGIFDVPAGGVVVVSVRSDILAGTAGQQVGVQLLSVVSNGTMDSTVMFPINGGLQSVSSAAIGTVDFNYTGPDNTTENPDTDVRVFEATATVSTHSVNLESIAIENRGTTDDGDLTNLKLFVGGVQVGSTVAQFVNKHATFDLSSAPKLLATGTHTIKVMADLVGGSSFTYNVQIRRAADVRMVDVELGQPILATNDAAAFTAVAPAAANTIAAGTLSLVRSATSPAGSVALSSTNVLWGTFEFRAAGEDVKIEAITVDVDVDGTTGPAGMDNGKVFVNGAQVGSTNDIAAGGTEFTFGSSFIAKAGQVMTVDIYGDAKTAAGVDYANATTTDVGISVATADTERMNSGTAITSAISEVEGFSRTISVTSLTANKYSGYGDQTVISGSNNVRLGSFTLSAGSTEGVNVNTIDVTLSLDESASITDLMLKNNVGGAQIGSTKPAPGTNNSFSVNLPIAKSGVVTIDLYGNIKSGSNIGTWQAVVAATTGGTGAVTGQSATVFATNLQTVTVGTAVLTGAVGSSNPNSANAIAGQSDVLVGSFDFTAQYSDFTVKKLRVKIPADAATSVASVKLKWTGGEASQVLAVPTTPTQTHATATFTGLTFPVAKNTTAKLDVYVNIPTIADGASTGAAISVSLDGNEGYSATDSAGNEDTTLTGSTADYSSNNATGKGVRIVRKSVPTLSAVALDSSALVAGTDKVLARVAVSADAAGDIGWKYMSFTVNKAAGVLIGATTTVKLYQAGNVVAGNFATTTGSMVGGGESFLAAVTSGNLVFEATSEEQIGYGTSKTYELRGTVAFDTDGDNLDISLANPTTSVSTAIYSTVLGTFGDGTPSFIWTDRSSISTVHSEATADWTNDYLIKTLPLTVGSKVGNL